MWKTDTAKTAEKVGGRCYTLCIEQKKVCNNGVMAFLDNQIAWQSNFTRMNPRDEAEVQRCVWRAEYTAWGPENFIVEIKAWSFSRVFQILVRHEFAMGWGICQKVIFKRFLLIRHYFSMTCL